MREVCLECAELLELLDAKNEEVRLTISLHAKAEVECAKLRATLKAVLQMAKRPQSGDWFKIDTIVSHVLKKAGEVKGGDAL